MFIILIVTEHILQICVISINGKTSHLVTSVKRQDITTDNNFEVCFCFVLGFLVFFWFFLVLMLLVLVFGWGFLGF